MDKKVVCKEDAGHRSEEDTPTGDDAVHVVSTQYDIENLESTAPEPESTYVMKVVA